MSFAVLCACASKCVTAFTPTLGSNTVIDNSRKGEGSADKEVECADWSIQRQKQEGMWGKARVQRKELYHCLTLLYLFLLFLSLRSPPFKKAVCH